MTSSMAFRIHGYGGPEVMTLDHVPTPVAGPGQCLVQVKAVGINPLDWKLREGFLSRIHTLHFPAILGSELAGTVIASGEAASRFMIGDRVMAMRGAAGGAYADVIAVDESTLSPVPLQLSYVEAAALPVVGLTGWKVLRAAGALRPGMTILVHGAAGGVGSFAVQFAKAAEARVFATASAANRDHVLGLGADTVIDYRAERFEEIVGPVDLVIDCVGGAALDRSWSVLAPDGAVVSIADPAGIATRAPAGVKAFWHSTNPDPERLAEIAVDVANGRLRSTIADVFAKSDLPTAIEVTRASHSPGKIVVDFAR